MPEEVPAALTLLCGLCGALLKRAGNDNGDGDDDDDDDVDATAATGQDEAGQVLLARPVASRLCTRTHRARAPAAPPRRRAATTRSIFLATPTPSAACLATQALLRVAVAARAPDLRYSSTAWVHTDNPPVSRSHGAARAYRRPPADQRAYSSPPLCWVQLGGRPARVDQSPLVRAEPAVLPPRREVREPGHVARQLCTARHKHPATAAAGRATTGHEIRPNSGKRSVCVLVLLASADPRPAAEEPRTAHTIIVDPCCRLTVLPASEVALVRRMSGRKELPVPVQLVSGHFSFYSPIPFTFSPRVLCRS
ncbi:uncharacterized protein V1518DRAFT_403200 [Limtongia smithiae]|uniref:uncharacterized protein n=1 Tax=Limtongia smithiae TaxID=1125753 RepID=UPI0034CF9CA3